MNDLNSSQCENCGKGFQLTTNRLICSEEILNCHFLDSLNASKCETCNNGFMMTTNR